MNEQLPVEQGQHNAAHNADQRLGPCYAPWIVLAVWLLIDLAVAVYYGSREWGPGPTETSLAIYLGFGANAVALVGWATVWLILSSDSLGPRLIYFFIALGGLWIAMLVSREADKEMAPEFAKLIVGVATPLVVMRRCGCRITAKEQSHREYGDAYVKGFQFSIFDLLTLTTGIAIFIGLLIADGTAGITEDVTNTSLFVSTVVVPSIVAFLVRLRWLVVGICVAVIGVVVAWATQSVLLVLGCGAGVCLSIAIGALRLCGYRLVCN